MMPIKLKGTFFASQAAGRIMIEQCSEGIINMSEFIGGICCIAIRVHLWDDEGENCEPGQVSCRGVGQIQPPHPWRVRAGRRVQNCLELVSCAPYHGAHETSSIHSPEP